MAQVVASEDSVVPAMELVAVLVVALEAALVEAVVLFLSLEIVESGCMHAWVLASSPSFRLP